jgi:hypothetical protein
MRAAAVIVSLAAGIAGAPLARAAPPPELAACAQAVTTGAASPVDLAQLPAETAHGAGVRARFALLGAAARTAEQAAIAAWAPAWKPTVEVDATGMATRVAITLPGARTPAAELPDALAFVRAHACLFGVADPAAIAAHVYDERYIFVTREPASIGAIAIDVAAEHGATTVTITGHFWPIADAEVTVPHAALARYLGRAMTQDWEDLAKATFGNHRTLHVKTSERELRPEGGHALICRKGVLDVHAAAYLDLAGTPDPDGPASDRARLAELPAVISLDDGAPYGKAWIMPRRIAPDENYAGEDRMNDAGAACLGIAPP